MKPAAFKATYSDFRLVKGRKIAQFIFEVPLEGADEALEILGGVPRPDREAWCAVARLQGSEVTPPATEDTVPSAQPAPVPTPDKPARASKSWHEMDYAQQAGVLCNDPKFRAFLEDHFRHWNLKGYFIPERAAERAAQIVRECCQVESRSDIKPGTPAENRWNLLVSAYRAWEQAPACGAA